MQRHILNDIEAIFNARFIRAGNGSVNSSLEAGNSV